MLQWCRLISVLLIVFLGTGTVLMAQVSLEELNQIETILEVKVEKKEKKSLKLHHAINPFYWIYQGGIKGYQKVLSPQIASNCIYEISCSRFSSLLVDEFGLIKGGFLSLDRITRCNRAHHAETSKLQKNPNGKIKESIIDFSHPR